MKEDEQLNSLQKEGTLEPVEMSKCVAPTVLVLKSDLTNILICGDFRLTMDPVSKLDK